MDHQTTLDSSVLLPAVGDEMRFFDFILADHGRVIRGILDWSEDERIRRGDRFAATFAALEARVSTFPTPAEESARAA
ncbi:MAG TPA: hypothetical protein GXX28_05470, partial [Firmicutes bacterium]|nr:hypothetical protein [Bacillota bacterium]